MPATDQGKEFALAELEKRRQKSRGEEQIDDSSLPAGSSMHIYCDCCGQLARKVPENYRPSQISHLCPECEALQQEGLIVQEPNSHRWKTA